MDLEQSNTNTFQIQNGGIHKEPKLGLSDQITDDTDTTSTSQGALLREGKGGGEEAEPRSTFIHNIVRPASDVYVLLSAEMLIRTSFKLFISQEDLVANCRKSCHPLVLDGLFVNREHHIADVERTKRPVHRFGAQFGVVEVKTRIS